ncbi:maleylpyruvate isomerase family mycothiol-dependent enzyme [Streptomyces sp. NPDC051940]|uniref:maleylpyruvate isomerase family mycothiol-dependent enzyme n=1 Tax=Streptomyces sp. NPDC051940 TaxID=3155675 RepID=UPI003426E837
MDHQRVLGAFDAEGLRLAEEMAAVGGDGWARPTRCEPWTVAELLAHVRMTAGRLPGMLAERPAPAHAEVTARGYYRPDERFSAGTNAVRVESAQELAARDTGHAEAFTATWREAAGLCAAEPESRVVRTRHGDPMLLTDFLVTRVVELAVHGLDLADALGRRPWTTEPAADVVEELLLGAPAPQGLPALGWDRSVFLCKATGRAAVTGEEKERLAELEVHWLTLG